MTYQVFLSQFHATGPEKVQGYSPVQFEGMSAAEVFDARAEMLERALDGDTTDLDGLRIIGEASTVARLANAEALASRFGARWDNVRRETLWILTGDAQYLKGCIQWLDANDPAAQRVAAETLARVSLPHSFAEPIAYRLSLIAYRMGITRTLLFR